MPNSADIWLSWSSNSSAGVSAVAIKTPAFWSDKPELWFAQLESQFTLGNISVDSNKFHYVLAALNSDDSTCVSVLVLNPPQNDSYNSLKIKTRLIAQNADSESVRLKKLLSGMELGDKRPSTLLYAMKSLASDGISPELLKGLWMQRLPIQIQQILSVSGDNLQALSEMADSIFEISKDDLVASVSDNFQSSDVNKFENRLAAIENRLSRLEVRRRSLSRGNTEVRGSNKCKYCWWYFKFGNKAKNANSHVLLNRKTSSAFRFGADGKKMPWLSACLFMIRLQAVNFWLTRVQQLVFYQFWGVKLLLQNLYCMQQTELKLTHSVLS
ncbi:hypothetical protein AVEN_5265-1 [Araneus ventricosus]|uniref:DUF7041 domain-containing protein n=1 Tax=Araneus ventricosus TaxID=182803 RepID=A0A4Y2E8J6_ARAVE|nr:hypothetical protein AVEN_5265-1 [Araneus ventricosus]